MASWFEWFCIFAALALAAVVTALPSPAHAQYACGDRDAIIKVLESKYLEFPTDVAIASRHNLIELFISQTGSWTMLETIPGGVTCVVRTGDGWEKLPVTVYGHAT